jgi:hypothetical protein
MKRLILLTSFLMAMLSVVVAQSNPAQFVYDKPIQITEKTGHYCKQKQ